ncbi:hypothetical protein UZ36_05710 [Candidatus Nitromaritima sp. SCGC AAA799-C22]|nr:hypothetical protein UZ36_05710 [Candidatus Nitromaritima sp. SCGC AAA799-C22]
MGVTGGTASAAADASRAVEKYGTSQENIKFNFPHPCFPAPYSTLLNANFPRQIAAKIRKNLKLLKNLSFIYCRISLFGPKLQNPVHLIIAKL